MNAIPRPRRCKHCRDKFQPSRHGQIVHEECIDGYAVNTIAKKRLAQERAAARRAAKLERESFKARKEAAKRLPDLAAAAQKAFNEFIRARDADRPCICCGRTTNDKDLLTGSRWDAGHYRSVGSASHLRFNEDNCHRQLVVCNRHGAGKAVNYRIGLIARIGLERVEALEDDNTPRKWTREELIAIKTEYRAKRKALEQQEEMT